VILPDVNILVYCSREDSPDHAAYKRWLDKVINGDQAFGLADMVLSSFLRIVTHPKIFKPPTPLPTAIAFVDALRSHPNRVTISPGTSHWSIFRTLCEKTNAKGNHVTDAYLAALAIESGSEWITTDRDFSRYAGLQWRHPFR